MFLMTFPMFNKFLTREECSVLFFGRGDAEDFKLKGFDFAARSVAAMSDTCYRERNFLQSSRRSMSRIVVKECSGTLTHKFKIEFSVVAINSYFWNF